MPLTQIPDGFTRLSPASLGDNLFTLIGKEWMLISAAGRRDADDPASYAVNTMTASWGTAGILWGKPVMICFIRPQRYTKAIADGAGRLSFSFLPETYRDALKYCGSHSGREGDKFAASGLSCAWAQPEGGEPVPYAAESRLVVIGRKLYADELKESCFLDAEALGEYPHRDFHTVYVCEIEDILTR